MLDLASQARALVRPPPRPRWQVVAAIVAGVFGGASVSAAGAVLFGPPSVRAGAGAVVPFVVWFNFVAGFAGVAAAVGFHRGRRWAMWLSLALALATGIVAAVFVGQIAAGVPFEWRTVVALSLRAAVWIALFVVSARHADRA
jgi:hypothetical protein